MLVVLAIVGVVAAAAPAVNHAVLDRVRLTYAVRSVAARIQNAEILAAAQDAPVGLSATVLDRGLFASVSLAATNGVDGLPAIWAYADGSASPALVVLTAGRRRATLVVNALDGRVDETE
jgi:hypothetical protein